MDIDEIQNYIAEHIGALKKPQDVSEAFDAHHDTFRRKFRRLSKQSLGECLTAARIRHMKKRLRTSDATCLDICLSAGFDREDTAERAFKRVTGLTMEAYRQQHRR